MPSKVLPLFALKLLPHLVQWTNETHEAAVGRVPEIKSSDVEEVFFGNVLSAKYVRDLIG